MVWVGKNFQNHHSKPLPWAGTPSNIPGCSGPHSTWSQMLNASPHPLLGWELSTCCTQSHSPECQDFRSVLSSARGTAFLALLSSFRVNVHFCTPCVQPGDSWGAGAWALPGHPQGCWLKLQQDSSISWQPSPSPEQHLLYMHNSPLPHASLIFRLAVY